VVVVVVLAVRGRDASPASSCLDHNKCGVDRTQGGVRLGFCLMQRETLQATRWRGNDCWGDG
jgi:hypothetical protein